MKSLLIYLLTLGSLSAFATTECDVAINNLVSYSNSRGQIKGLIIRYDIEIHKDQEILRILEENPDSTYLNTCFSKISLGNNIKENTQAIKDLYDSSESDTLDNLKIAVKNTCK